MVSMCSKSKGRFHFLNVVIISELPCNPFAKKGNSLKTLIDNLPQQQKNTFFSLLCARLVLLCFAKLGCSSAQQRKKHVFFFVMRSPCTTLLRQVRLQLGTTTKKTRFFLCYALALH